VLSQVLLFIGCNHRFANICWREIAFSSKHFPEDFVKKLLGLFIMSGATLAALFFLTSLARVGGGASSQALTLKPASNIQEGSIVSIEYTLTDDSGKVIDTNVGKEPLTFIQGAGQIVSGLEKELQGLKPGDQKKVQVKPEDGYGMPNQQAFQELPRESIPPEAQKAGVSLMAKGPDGRAIPIRVHEIKEKTVVVDFNHPLAGKTLNFDVKIKDIKAAEAR
jgi:FKBP-type peptidyl-prolyl cis-trans isomerase SlyD